ncbi:hypothetical protein B0T09DRAFT_340089 [Sordaria sp. MPI-SDFR-AT-0083]|nr:hypothetical protein B0T09DRAFT_340089 [Sordaria sp. MPI-SDFR-AT-0083]
MIALGYRGGTICLWEVQSQELIGFARDEENRCAATLLFNPNPNISMLLVIYLNPGLSLDDTWSGALNNSYNMPDNVGLFSASCTPDGRTLVTTDSQGHINIWDFESLTVVYHVFSPFPSFRLLNFTSDGSSVVDVTDSGMRIWSPDVLGRKTMEEDTAQAMTLSSLPLSRASMRPGRMPKSLCSRHILHYPLLTRVCSTDKSLVLGRRLLQERHP